jgi:intracellular multiplication protein IcmV
MGLFKSLKKGLSYIFDFRVDQWLNLKMIKDNTLFYARETKELFTIDKSDSTENFEEATTRLRLTEDFIKNQTKRYFYLTCLFLVSAGLILAYGVYIALQGNIMGGCICFCLTVYALSCAFRFHFWYFQMKRKKLGCSIQEWLKSIQAR